MIDFVKKLLADKYKIATSDFKKASGDYRRGYTAGLRSALSEIENCISAEEKRLTSEKFPTIAGHYASKRYSE